MPSRSVNGAGDVTGNVDVYGDDGRFLWEGVVNLSESRPRAALISDVAARPRVSRDRARDAVLQLMEDQRAAHLGVDEGGEAPKGERKDVVLATAFLADGVVHLLDQSIEPHVVVPSGHLWAIYRM